MPVTCTEILVRLRRPPDVYHSQSALKQNHIRLRISPDVAIAIGMMVLTPDKETAGRPIEMVASHHPEANEMDAYERVLGEAIAGDTTLFAREDYVEEAWRIVDPVLRADTPVHEYEPGTWGPTVESPPIVPAGGWHAPVPTPSTPSRNSVLAA
jgi:glucose-6-phosphate 1-dehydrogenase